MSSLYEKNIIDTQLEINPNVYTQLWEIKYVDLWMKVERMIILVFFLDTLPKKKQKKDSREKCIKEKYIFLGFNDVLNDLDCIFLIP